MKKNHCVLESPTGVFDRFKPLLMVNYCYNNKGREKGRHKEAIGEIKYLVNRKALKRYVENYGYQNGSDQILSALSLLSWEVVTYLKRYLPPVYRKLQKAAKKK